MESKTKGLSPNTGPSIGIRKHFFRHTYLYTNSQKRILRDNERF